MSQYSKPYRSADYRTGHNWQDPPSFSDEIRFHDTTFRDGERQLGVVFSEDEKAKPRKRYSKIGIDHIEPELPLGSKAGTNSIQWLANESLAAEIYHTMRKEIER